MKRTKKEIAVLLDGYSPLHNFSAEKGPCSYRNYAKAQLIAIAVRLGVIKDIAFIRNAYHDVAVLEAVKPGILDYIAQYFAHYNCWPDTYINGENMPEINKCAFVYFAINDARYKHK